MIDEQWAQPRSICLWIREYQLKSRRRIWSWCCLGNNGGDINFEVDGFYNYINHFIFSDRLGTENGGDSLILGKPAYKYNANTALLPGNCIYKYSSFQYKWFEINNGFTYIYSYLPVKPDSTGMCHGRRPRLTSKAKFKLSDKNGSIIKGTYFEFGLAKYWHRKTFTVPSGPSCLLTIYFIERGHRDKFYWS